MMNKHYFDVELISPQSRSYVSNNKKFKRISDNDRKFKEVDHFAARYYRELSRWEFVIQRLLSRLTVEVQNRILRYSNINTGIRYREIDFIAQSSKDELIFCELKLKENFSEKLGSKASGWAQLNKSLVIAGTKYQKLGALSICVDMSHVYGLETKAIDLNYCKFAALKNHLEIPSLDNKTLWINSKEIASLAIEHELLTLNDVNEIKKLFQEFKDPLSTIVIDNFNVSQNPFQELIQLKSFAPLNK